MYLHTPQEDEAKIYKDMLIEFQIEQANLSREFQVQ